MVPHIEMKLIDRFLCHSSLANNLTHLVNLSVSEGEQMETQRAKTTDRREEKKIYI